MNAGMFESLDKLAPAPNFVTLMSLSPQPTARPKKPDDNSIQNSVAGSTGPVTRAQAQAQKQKLEPQSDVLPSRYKIGDRVVVYDKDQHPIRGTVKWTGLAFSLEERVNAVGIETVLLFIMIC